MKTKIRTKLLFLSSKQWKNIDPLKKMDSLGDLYIEVTPQELIGIIGFSKTNFIMHYSEDKKRLLYRDLNNEERIFVDAYCKLGIELENKNGA